MEEPLRTAKARQPRTVETAHAHRPAGTVPLVEPESPGGRDQEDDATGDGGVTEDGQGYDQLTRNGPAFRLLRT
jgi:hypothetical protein